MEGRDCKRTDDRSERSPSANAHTTSRLNVETPPTRCIGAARISCLSTQSSVSTHPPSQNLPPIIPVPITNLSSPFQRLQFARKPPRLIRRGPEHTRAKAVSETKAPDLTEMKDCNQNHRTEERGRFVFCCWERTRDPRTFSLSPSPSAEQESACWSTEFFSRRALRVIQAQGTPGTRSCVGNFRSDGSIGTCVLSPSRGLGRCSKLNVDHADIQTSIKPHLFPSPTFLQIDFVRGDISASWLNHTHPSKSSFLPHF